MSKFKVGEMVRLKREGSPCLNGFSTGQVVKIEKIDTTDWSYTVVSDGFRGYAKIEDLEKIEDEPKTVTEMMMNMAVDNIARMNYSPMFVDPEMFYGKSLGESLMERKSPKRKSYMSSIVEKIKNLKLSETDRILRKHGFEDESGKMTSEAMDMMDEESQQERWVTRREQIAADIKAVEESDKK